MGRSRYSILKHCVGVKWDPRRTAAYVPFHFHGFELHFLLCVSWNCDFSWTAYHKDLQQVPLDLACLKPQIQATQAISMHFSQSKSTKCEISGCFLSSPWQKTDKNINLLREKVFSKACKSAHIGLWVCQLQCPMLELCVTSTFWVIMVFLHFYGKVKI